MKTAISLPDETFDRVTTRAATLGMSRSQLFTVAVTRYLDDLEQDELTAQIDAAVDAAADDDSSRLAVEAGRRILAARPDEW
jgi:predicted DNA-binding protein